MSVKDEMPDAAFICADWGTTSLRLWATTRDGIVVGAAQNSQGMSALSGDDYAPIIERFAREHKLGADIPAIVCGMAGAAQGWREAAYVDIPTDLSGLHNHAVRPRSDARDVRILPGLAKRDPALPDVIRGEETILLGATGDIGAEATICLPGTHSKWVRVTDGRVTDFQSFMTGEMFALLRSQSTLRHFMTGAVEPEDEDSSFKAAVTEALEHPETILSTLFSVRAKPLLFGTRADRSLAARLSGLLIGLELAGAMKALSGPVVLLASGELAARYSAALESAGRQFRQVDADAAVRRGLQSAALDLWPLN